MAARVVMVDTRTVFETAAIDHEKVTCLIRARRAPDGTIAFEASGSMTEEQAREVIADLLAWIPA